MANDVCGTRTILAVVNAKTFLRLCAIFCFRKNGNSKHHSSAEAHESIYIDFLSYNVSPLAPSELLSFLLRILPSPSHRCLTTRAYSVRTLCVYFRDAYKGKKSIRIMIFLYNFISQKRSAHKENNAYIFNTDQPILNPRIFAKTPLSFTIKP